MKCLASHEPQKQAMSSDPQEAGLRLFFALWPDPETRAALAALQQRIKGRKTLYGNLHVTLAFQGMQSATLLPLLRQILAGLPPPDLTLDIDRIGYFARRRIAWAGSHQPPDTLLTLQRSLTEALLQHHVAFDNRPSFTPHITLARDAAPPSDFPFDPIRWHAGHVALVQSSTLAEGAAYRVLASLQLERDS
jgi:2'-5' RNA ligase